MAAKRDVYLLLSFLAFGCCLATQVDFVPENDLKLLVRKLGSALPYKDLASAYYSVAGLSAINEKIPDKQDVCGFVKKSLTSNVMNLYYAAFVGDHLKCKIPTPSDAQEVLTSAIQYGGSTANIFHAVAAMSKLGLKVDHAVALESLKAALEKDESVLSNSYAFHAAVYLAKEVDVSSIVDIVEDVLSQADEIGEKVLQFDGEIRNTVLFVAGAYSLYEATGVTPVINKEQAIKLTNYIVSRRHVASVEDAYYIASGLAKLSTNKYHNPGSLVLISQPSVQKSNGVVTVKACNIFGKPFTKMEVKATSVLSPEGASIGNNIILTEKTAGEYQFDMNKLNPERGFYTVHLSAKPTQDDSRLIGLTDVSIKVKRVVPVSLETLRIKTSDDSTVHAETKADFPGELSKPVSADEHSVVTFNFAVKDKDKNSRTLPQQAFLRVISEKNNNIERTFMFTAKSDHSLSLELAIAQVGKDIFSWQSGLYSMDVIVGDPTFSNQIYWKMGKLSLTFSAAPVTPKSKPPLLPKPEILHVFRTPEQRPPAVLSKAFTALTVVPLLMMFVMWNRFGVNISSFSFSLPNIVFHLGLGSIFLLYYCYWCYLDMFTTLKYLVPIGGITFLSGNAVLRNIANARQNKELS